VFLQKQKKTLCNNFEVLHELGLNLKVQTIIWLEGGAQFRFIKLQSFDAIRYMAFTVAG